MTNETLQYALSYFPPDTDMNIMYIVNYLQARTALRRLRSRGGSSAVCCPSNSGIGIQNGGAIAFLTNIHAGATRWLS